MLCKDAGLLSFGKLYTQTGYYLHRDLILDFKYVLKITIIVLCPEMLPVSGIDQLGGDSYPVTGLSGHCPPEHIEPRVPGLPAEP